MADFEVQDEGTIALLTPMSEAAHDWVKDNLPDEVMYFGQSVVIEHRYVGDILDGIVEDGLEIAA